MTLRIEATYQCRSCGREETIRAVGEPIGQIPGWAEIARPYGAQEHYCGTCLQRLRDPEGPVADAAEDLWTELFEEYGRYLREVERGEPTWVHVDALKRRIETAVIVDASKGPT